MVAALLGVGTAAAEPAPVSVWYRTSEGCPDGESFVARLNGLGHSARLAGVGDRVDFVVTLGHERDRSSGRLERQTRSGTVAIRDYHDPDCAQIAEALALTLDLALEPGAAPSPERGGLAADSSGPEPLPAVRATTPGAFSPSDAVVQSTGLDGKESRASLALGAQATLAAGVAPNLLAGGALFLKLESSGALPRSSRLTLLGGHAEGTSSSRELDVTLLGVRAEICPLSWMVSTEVVLEPCAAGEAGVIRGAGGAPAGSADHGVWGAVLAHGRVAFRIGGPLWLEAQVGGRVPLFRYEMGTRDGSEDWFRTRAVGLDGGVGAAWQIW